MDTVLYCGRRMNKEQLQSYKEKLEVHLAEVETQRQNPCNSSQELIYKELVKELSEKIKCAEEKLEALNNMEELDL